MRALNEVCSIQLLAPTVIDILRSTNLLALYNTDAAEQLSCEHLIWRKYRITIFVFVLIRYNGGMRQHIRKFGLYGVHTELYILFD